MPVKNTLSAAERLKSRKLIDQLFKEGKGFTVFPIRLIYIFPQKQSEPLTAGFSVSSRHFKKAVDRNRVKRLMREAFRVQKHELADSLKTNDKKLALFFIYTGKEVPEHSIVFEKLGLTLTRLLKSIG